MPPKPDPLPVYVAGSLKWNEYAVTGMAAKPLSLKELQQAMKEAYAAHTAKSLFKEKATLAQIKAYKKLAFKAVGEPMPKPKKASVMVNHVGLTCTGFDYALGVPHPHQECCPECLEGKTKKHKRQWQMIPPPVLPDGIVRPESEANLCCRHTEALAKLIQHGGWVQYRKHRLAVQVHTEKITSAHCNLMPVYYHNGAMVTSDDPHWVKLHEKALESMGELTEAQTKAMKEWFQKVLDAIADADACIERIKDADPIGAADPYSTTMDYVNSVIWSKDKLWQQAGLAHGGFKGKPWLASTWKQVETRIADLKMYISNADAYANKKAAGTWEGF